MKIGDMSLSNEGVGDIIESGENDDKSMINTIGETDKNISDQETILTIDNKKENLVDNLNGSDGWLNLPQSSTAARTDEWVKLIDSQNNNQALQQFVKTKNNNFHTVNNQQKGWDIINTDSNAFDLLSYLCDVSPLINLVHVCYFNIYYHVYSNFIFVHRMKFKQPMMYPWNQLQLIMKKRLIKLQ